MTPAADLAVRNAFKPPAEPFADRLKDFVDAAETNAADEMHAVGFELALSVAH